MSALSAGNAHSLALTTAGKVLAWGQGTEGELGDGIFADSHSPVQVQIPTGLAVTAIAAGPGAFVSLAIVHTVP